MSSTPFTTLSLKLFSLNTNPFYFDETIMVKIFFFTLPTMPHDHHPLTDQITITYSLGY